MWTIWIFPSALDFIIASDPVYRFDVEILSIAPDSFDRLNKSELAEDTPEY